jgi:hypothetical protein
MIDEEDDEDVLKKGISLKNVLKNIILIVLIIVGALFIYLGGGQDSITNFFIGFSLICFGSTLIQIQKQKPEPTMQTLSILKCLGCDFTQVRNYQSGDYVFKIEEKCNNCNEQLQISQIYSVKLKKKAKKKKSETRKESTPEK